MKIETYLKTAIATERRKAEIVDILGLYHAETGDSLQAVKYRYLDGISQTAQRRLLAVSEQQAQQLAATQARVAELEEPLRWLVNCCRDVSRFGGDSVADDEWERATELGVTILKKGVAQ